MANGTPRELNESLLDELSLVVSRAGAAILSAQAGSLRVRSKADQSPVTTADQASEHVIIEGIVSLLPGVAIVSEEAVASCPPAELPSTFVLVDPLDGTREFIAGRNEFTINLAIVSDGLPRLGIVAAPACGLLWRGIQGRGAERLTLAAGAALKTARERAPIHTRPWPVSGLTVAVSRSHLDGETAALLARLPQAQRIVAGSAIKFCQIAEGEVDFYPRLSPTCEWDVAAGHAIVGAAGGVVLSAQGQALSYGRVSTGLRVAGFTAWGDPSAPATSGLLA
jgi:3'(2'), 5'-bisphosphate nucleotidase